ncbi:MAG: helix-turn-helix domain-containing protein [Pseudomonadota bacterium]
MASIQGTNISSDNTKLYRSLGSLIKEYRKWRKMSQEKFSESIQISVRELQNWESDRRSPRIENLHDLSEMTGLPMQALIALNADQPVWYSLGKRFFKYSLIEEDQFLSRELLRYQNKSADDFLVKYIPITTDRQINMILSCHRDIYGTERPLPKDVIKKAARFLPNLNNTIIDCWGHYVGHQICLPIKADIYKDIIKSKCIENYLSLRSINDIISMDAGVLFYYSVHSACVSVGRRLVIDSAQSLSEIKQKENFLLATHTATKEAKTIQSNIGMRFVRDYAHRLNETNPVIYEQNLDVHIKLRKPYVWMIEHISGQSGKMPEQKSLISVDESSLGVDRNLSYNKNINPVKQITQACTNSACKLYGKTKQGNVVSNGTYRTKDGLPGRRFLCKTCGKSFCNRTGTMFHGLRSSEDKFIKALKLLLKGMPLQKAADSLGISFNTIRHWLSVSARHCDKINAILEKDPEVSQADLDTLWAFVRKNSLRQRAALWNWSENK